MVFWTPIMTKTTIINTANEVPLPTPLKIATTQASLTPARHRRSQALFGIFCSQLLEGIGRGQASSLHETGSCTPLPYLCLYLHQHICNPSVCIYINHQSLHTRTYTHIMYVHTPVIADTIVNCLTAYLLHPSSVATLRAGH